MANEESYVASIERMLTRELKGKNLEQGKSVTGSIGDEEEKMPPEAILLEDKGAKLANLIDFLREEIKENIKYGSNLETRLKRAKAELDKFRQKADEELGKLRGTTDEQHESTKRPKDAADYGERR